MLSKSSVATTAQESAYRIKHPNSAAPVVKAILLDQHIAAAFQAINAAEWPNLSIYTLEASSPTLAFRTAQGRIEDATLFATDATLIVIFSSHCLRIELAAQLGQLLNSHHRLPTLFVLENGDSEPKQIGQLLKTLRPHAGMIVHTQDPDYIASMLSALRA